MLEKLAECSLLVGCSLSGSQLAKKTEPLYKASTLQLVRVALAGSLAVPAPGIATTLS